VRQNVVGAVGNKELVGTLLLLLYVGSWRWRWRTHDLLAIAKFLLSFGSEFILTRKQNDILSTAQMILIFFT